ncbi:PABP-interacting PAM2 motif-containing protein [Legionella longbeachae]|nr:PABP-interacting PAM2 motif-containing protein [Legionella longbeachae]EEZ94119.1 hypothetical protein LLB_3019 [Legionella longbeachae D-4968]UAK46301.1 hypothetical protein K8O86_16300 [Legionella longbeachae]VEE03290.1 Uncharacterised protein [Legionella oakridgensis]HBD7399142.1 hypothetical protein [Legionella pneumophila]
MIPTGDKSKSTTYQDCTFESVILRMKQSDLKVNASIATYISYNNQLKGKNLRNITALLTEMLNNHVFPNTVILNQLIKRLSQLNQLQLSLDVHQMAVTKGLANAITYNITLNAIAKSAQPDVQLTLRLLEEAKKAGLANAITYASTLDAIAKSVQPDAQLAGALIDEAIEHFKLLDMRNGIRLDLHGLSFGLVYFGLKRRVLQEMDASHSISTLTLIYGKGLHSSSRDGIHPVKRAVWRVVSELSGQGISGQENKRNSGVFELSFRTVRSQPNATNPHRLFTSKLNPNAKPFIPTSSQNSLS